MYSYDFLVDTNERIYIIFARYECGSSDHNSINLILDSVAVS